MPATQASDKLPFAGKDDPAEELLPEPTEAELRVAELEQENRQLRDDAPSAVGPGQRCRVADAVSSSAQRLRIVLP